MNAIAPTAEIHAFEGACAPLDDVQLEALYRHQIAHGQVWGLFLHRLWEARPELARIMVQGDQVLDYPPGLVKRCVLGRARRGNRGALLPQPAPQATSTSTIAEWCDAWWEDNAQDRPLPDPLLTRHGDT